METGRGLSLTVIVPTIGRDTLAATVRSIPDEWRTLVIADGSEAFGKACMACAGTRARVVATPQTNDVGHTQRNTGMSIAQTEWLAFMDDDDTYVPDVQKLVDPQQRRPHIYRMRYCHGGGELWQTEQVREGNVGTPMFVLPNDPAKLASWPSRRSGDFAFIQETCALYEQPPVWVDQVIALIRPHEM